MVLQLPVVVLLSAAVLVLWRTSGLRFAHALACVLLGFFLAGSRAGPGTGRFLESLVDALEGSHL
jgi:hypothetical protein